MSHLALAGILFLLTHLGISSTPARGLLLGSLGERGYQALYSIIAAVTLVYFVMVFIGTSHTEFLWAPSLTLRWVALVLMAVAFVLLLGGFMTRNPTAVGQEGTIKEVGEGAGLVRITRHPFQWSVVIWAVAHVLANGDAASLIFFGLLGLVSLLGTFLIDRKKAVTMGEDWAPFAQATSNIPFGAILSGRNRIVIGELWMPVLVGGLGYALVLWLHEWISGVALF